MDEAASLSPSNASRQLRVALRRARESRAWTQEQVAEEMDWSPSKLHRIEAGAVSISINDLRALCTLLDVGSAATAQLLEYRRWAQLQPWWYPYRSVLPPAMMTLLDLESDAVAISIATTMVIPDVFQSDDYRAALHGADVASDADRRAVQATRRDIYLRTDGPEVRVLLDEAVLYRVVGNADVMAVQLFSLAEAARRPTVRLRLLPMEAGHLGIGGTFILLSSGAGGKTLYSENYDGATHTAQGSPVRDFEAALARLDAVSLSAARTNHLLHSVAARYEHGGQPRPWL